jgi:hypothetical protein
MLVFGFVPTALVARYYDMLPRRLVIQWDMFGNTTIIGTRASTVLMIANVAAVIALAAIAIAMWQHRTLVAFGMRRAYLALNLAQIAVINLTCAMLVTDALGFQLKIKPVIPPAMAVLLFAAGVLVWQMEGRLARIAGIALSAGGVLLLAFSAIAANQALGYYASAFALIAMIALLLPQES